MTNGQILDILETTVSLMELHEENAFKIKTLQNALFHLEKVSDLLFEMDKGQLESLQGVGKGIASKIVEINYTGTLQELEFLLSSTPPGVVDLLGIKGVGPKKVRTIWKELHVESLEELRQVCLDKKLASTKGFGDKTQETVLKSIDFILSNKGKFLYADIEDFALRLEKTLQEIEIAPLVSLSGDVRRKMEIVSVVQLIVGTDSIKKTIEALDQFAWLEKDEKKSGPFVWRGKDKVLHASVELKLFSTDQFGSQLYLHSSSNAHLQTVINNSLSFNNYLLKNNFKTEREIFQTLGIQEIVPEFRESVKAFSLAKENNLPTLLEVNDLKGALHNHSNYSDGKNTLLEMAEYCKSIGYSYLGISDHSKTATYANGLQEFRVSKQHQEIELLNKSLLPFKIFKGIESDILTDGSLDYDDSVLKTFDFVVASIHSGFSMDEPKATQRLIKAIENPFTTFLGHMTGRILLRREGYPVNHKKIIEACAANKVIIEINANPHRLDIDWRWIEFALDKGVILSINPDAHERAGFHDMKFGVFAGRKGGLTKEFTFNAWDVDKVESWFFDKKKNA